MLPTLSPTGDWVFNNRLPFHYPRLIRPFSRGDVVTAVHPFMPDRIVGKRIIALEGDTVEVNPGRIRVDVDEHLNGEQKYVRIPKGHCWLQGDNLSNSTDSRDYGPVPMALLLARVETRVRFGPFFWGSRHSKTDPSFLLGTDLSHMDAIAQQPEVADRRYR